MRKSKRVTEHQYRAAIHAIESGRGRKDILDRLAELYEAEHGNCGCGTCAMTKAFECGYSIMAIDLFASSGAARDEFYRLLSLIPKRALATALSFERESFRNDPDCDAIPCAHGCGAYIYDWMWHGERVCCDNCGNQFSAPDKSA